MHFSQILSFLNISKNISEHNVEIKTFDIETSCNDHLFHSLQLYFQDCCAILTYCIYAFGLQTFLSFYEYR